MSGGFACIDDPTGTAGAGGVLQQQTPTIPIGWYGQTADRSPYTTIGGFDLENYTTAVAIHLPAPPRDGTRLDRGSDGR